MIDDEPAQRRGALGAAGGGLVVAALVVASLVARRLDLGLPAVGPPDLHLPDRLRWLGPVLGVGKLLFLVGLGVLAVLGEWERRRRRSGGSPR